jgi:cellobiose phosphorylase
LNPGEESNYDLPSHAEKTEMLYDHCVRALERSFHYGVHGLPLIGSGDWNDGLDRVGNEGKGESVWLAFFLYSVCIQFREIAKQKGDSAFAEKCLKQAESLSGNIDAHGWDGEWYRRAYFDDGSPLGSQLNDECKIDSIPQSWSVLSGAGDKQKSLEAMESAYDRLVRKDLSIIQLFDPPFDHSSMNPGYIKGYAPGVRENGGQYTHAAVWLVMAFASLKDRKKTWELLQMINPVNFGISEESISKYKVEPYVIAADVYALDYQKGRGGWTWYTGSAGWMYQLIIDSFIGICRKGNTISLNPCIPEEWNSCFVSYRYLDTMYSFQIVQDKKQKGIKLFEDGQLLDSEHVNLLNDRADHKIKLLIGLAEEKEKLPALS